MGSYARQSCWPSHFIIKWSATLVGAILAGILFGAATHKPHPKPLPPAHNITVYLLATVKYPNSIDKRVGADVWTCGPPPNYEAGARLGTTPLGNQKESLLPFSRPPGTVVYLRFRWGGQDKPDRVSFPNSGPIPWTFEFIASDSKPHHVEPLAR